MNPLIFIANVLASSYKLAHIKWSFGDIYEFEMVESIVKIIKDEMNKLYEWYVNKYRQHINSFNDETPLFF